MATARPQTVINELRQFLENNITDPNPDRPGSDKWVYTIPINYDIANYPRIHIQNVSGTHNGYSIGSTTRQVDTLVQISIFHGTGPGNKMDIDGDDELEPVNEIVDFLAEKVIDLINGNQSKWQAEGDNIHYFITQDENLVQDEKNSVVQYVITAELRNRR